MGLDAKFEQALLVLPFAHAHEDRHEHGEAGDHWSRNEGAAREPAVLWRARRAFVAAPMIACFAVFVAVFVRVREWENEQGLLEFRVQSHRIADTISASLDEHALFLEQLSSVFATRGSQPSRQEFRALVQT